MEITIKALDWWYDRWNISQGPKNTYYAIYNESVDICHVPTHRLTRLISIYFPYVEICPCQSIHHFNLNEDDTG